jgi:methylenetetrahydrofolate dehydrogenase (NADP+)/methenyltetrahydrofolate cyclohydrolase
MAAVMLDGRKLQEKLLDRAVTIARDAGVVPHVAFMMVENDDPMTAVNFRLHCRIFTRVGFRVREIVLPNHIDQAGVNRAIEEQNADDDVDVIMMLVPLPDHIDIRVVLRTIAPEKEAEGLHPTHAARLSPLSVDPPTRFPVVPLSILYLLEELNYDPVGPQLVVVVDPELIARSPIGQMVSRVAAWAALPPDASGTLVPMDHPHAAEITRTGDVVIVTLAKPRVITADWIKPGAVVIDFNAIPESFAPHPDDPDRLVPTLCGGVDVDSVREVAMALAAVPGGLGPTMLGTLAEQIAGIARDRAKARAAAAVPAGV